MAISYAVNGTTALGVTSTWVRIANGTDAAGLPTFSNYARNVWEAPRMTAAVYEALQAQLGAELTSLDTNDIDDRDAGAQYATVVLRSLKGEQIGTFMADVRAEFEVKVS